MTAPSQQKRSPTSRQTVRPQTDKSSNDHRVTQLERQRCQTKALGTGAPRWAGLEPKLALAQERGQRGELRSPRPAWPRSPLAQWWGPRAPRGKQNEAQSHCLQRPRPRPEPGAPTPPAHSVSHSPTPQLRANRAKAFFFFFLQVNEISCLLGKTLTLLVKETQWLAKSTHRSRKRSPTLRHV